MAGADDGAVFLHDINCGVNLFLHFRHQLVKETQRHINGGNAPLFVAFINRHGAVGAWLGAGVIEIRRSPDTLPFFTFGCGEIPGLIEIVRRFCAVPESIHRQLIITITGKEGAEFDFCRVALVRQRPDTATKHGSVAVLINQSGQQPVDTVAVHLCDGLGDGAYLRLNLVKTIINSDCYIIHLICNQITFRLFQLRSNKDLDHDKRNDDQHNKKQADQCDKAGLRCF